VGGVVCGASRAASSIICCQLLSRKRTSWEWQWRAIGSALNVLNPALRAEARVVMSFPAEEAILDSVTLAAASAQRRVESMTCDPHDGVRATWRAGPVDHLPAPEDTLRIILQERGEPTHALVLRAGLLVALGQTAALAEIAQQSQGEQTPLAVLRGQIDRAWSAASLREIEPHRWC